MKLTTHFWLCFWADSTHYKVWYSAGQVLKHGRHWLAATIGAKKWTKRPTRASAICYLARAAIKDKQGVHPWDVYVRGRARKLFRLGGRISNDRTTRKKEDNRRAMD